MSLVFFLLVESIFTLAHLLHLRQRKDAVLARAIFRLLFFPGAVTSRISN